MCQFVVGAPNTLKHAGSAGDSAAVGVSPFQRTGGPAGHDCAPAWETIPNDKLERRSSPVIGPRRRNLVVK